MVADAPTLVRVLGLVRPISWTRRPQIRTNMGIPKPFSKPPWPLAAALRVGQTSQMAPSKISTEDAATSLSNLS